MTTKSTRMGTLIGLLAVAAAGLSGCTSGVSMDNQSNTWLNVRYYVATPTGDTESVEFVAVGRQQIEPGSSASFDLATNPSFNADGGSVVHVQVEPATASWEEAHQYWLELLTPVPLSLSVTGDPDELKFSSEDAQFAEIPAQTRAGRKYRYTTLAAAEPKDESDAEESAESSSDDAKVAEVVDHDS
jgi:hypothetical protein